jgi:hypothetical protein
VATPALAALAVYFPVAGARVAEPIPTASVLQAKDEPAKSQTTPGTNSAEALLESFFGVEHASGIDKQLTGYELTFPIALQFSAARANELSRQAMQDAELPALAQRAQALLEKAHRFAIAAQWRRAMVLRRTTRGFTSPLNASRFSFTSFFS